MAVVLLLVGGSEALTALQAMTVSTGLPFAIVLLVMCYSTWRGLAAAHKSRRRGNPPAAARTLFTRPLRAGAERQRGGRGRVPKARACGIVLWH